MKGYKELDACYNCRHSVWLQGHYNDEPEIMVCAHGKDMVWQIEASKKYSEGDYDCVSDEFVVEPNGFCCAHEKGK
jgi:hypothetical protein